MALFKITQKQGNRTITSTLEANSWQEIKAFLDSVSTARTACIYEVHFEDEKQPPIDDFNYFKQYKSFVGNISSSISRQVLVHNVKPVLNEDEISSLIKTYLRVGGQKIDSVKCRLFMRD